MIDWLRGIAIFFGASGVLIDLMAFPVRLQLGASSPIADLFLMVSVLFLLIAVLCIKVSIRLADERDEW